MSEHATISAAIDAAAAHPVVASTVAATTTAGGTIAMIATAQTVLGAVSVALGCVVAVLVIRVQWLKGSLLQRDLDERGKENDQAAIYRD